MRDDSVYVRQRTDQIASFKYLGILTLQLPEYKVRRRT